MNNNIFRTLGLTLAFALFAVSMSAKDLKGKILGLDINQKSVPLLGAVVQWEGAKTGAKSDKNGNFKIERNSKNNKLTVTYVGYSKKTLDISADQTEIEIQLDPISSGNVEVVAQQPAQILSKSVINTNTTTLHGLRKAACCNLAESFVANPSVDVNYSDAVTGAKQIELLGLLGSYTQMMTENIPNLRGLATTYGLNYVPGQWMESIQISKGSASVASGYESITGQVNVEYKKPSGSDPLFVNLYGSMDGRLEGDVTTAFKVTDKLGTNLFLHANYYGGQEDKNKDSFIDMPMEKQFAALNRWEYENDGLHTVHTIKVLNETRQSGQKDYFPDKDPKKYGIQIKTERYEVFGKAGYVLPTEAYHSIAAMYSASYHDQNSYFGKKDYTGTQKSLFGKLLYETRWGQKEIHFKHSAADHEHEGHNHEAEEAHEHEGHNHEAEEAHEHEGHNHEAEEAHEHEGHNHEAEEAREAEEGHEHNEEIDIHRLNMGLSFNFDQFHEKYMDTTINKIERIPGVFGEYTYSGIDNVSLVGGLRVDFHNIFGTLYTPRFHAKYQPFRELSFRASAGKGYHINNIFAENSGVLASSRTIQVLEKLDPEEAWNYGLNMNLLFNVLGKEFTLNAEYYRTDFINQVIVDLEKDPGKALFYNLKGDSYSNSYQVDLTFSPIHRFEIMTAYRYNDVKMTVDGKLIQKPLSSKYKAFINLAYATDFDEWKFDFTATLNGGGTLPSTEANPVEYRLDKEFKPYITLYAQITKKFGDVQVYVGGENLTDYRQKHAIVSADNPFGKYFDSSMVWGPLMGRKIYAGIRMNVL
jgi:outer membrane receptor for ferrienterochelin and colicin